ncbi:N-acetylglucosamine-1-phosphodiester alpha-N-acetylglucosaminidase [Acrasis kona]|uniref:N-acetylglucosamine-1-phosphodiester alpha-N-acetylglucosaminidase n=1 Tax=Acrasis kona TaxID=1008807 RepID=A0AAW2ZFL3_9EUKA
MLWSLLPIVFFICFSSAINNSYVDIASRPYYFQDTHGPILKKSLGRSARNIQEDYIVHKIHSGNSTKRPKYDFYELGKDFTTKKHDGVDLVNGKYIRLHNPLKHFSILEPANTCKNKTAHTVKETATKAKKCIVATNAGFFNVHTHECLGNVISNSQLVQSTTNRNANFGITKKGNYYVGYMTPETPKANQDEFVNLVSGVIWLIRDGKNYVKESEKLEFEGTQASGSINYFVNLRSSRIGLGHDAEGRLVIVQFDGDGNHDKGLNLHELAELMIGMGVINAINLDGGGSTTVVHHNYVANAVSDGADSCPHLPSDLLFREMIRCERKVTTITCIHNDVDLDDSKNNQNKELLPDCKTVDEKTTRFIVLGASGVLVFLLLLIIVLMVMSIVICCRNEKDKPFYDSLDESDEDPIESMPMQEFMNDEQSSPANDVELEVIVTPSTSTQ